MQTGLNLVPMYERYPELDINPNLHQALLDEIKDENNIQSLKGEEKI